MNFSRLKDLIFKLVDGVKLVVAKYFIASDNDSKVARIKHLRFGVLLVVIFLLLCFLIIKIDDNKSENPKIDNKTSEKITNNASAIKELTKGVSNEQTWTEIRGKEVDEIKTKQIESQAKQFELEEVVTKDKISRDELADLMLQLKNKMEEEYNQKLESVVNQIREENAKKVPENVLESKIIKQKKKIKKIGQYIPANSYAQAKLIAGVDAGVGLSSEANPRQTLLRITGQAISAGIGADYLKTDRLIGCLLSAKAVGDISSEKAYLDGVLLTCAVDKHTAVEVPVKAYVTSHAKSGIRGEVVSREGDMVLKSFLSGLTSGFGHGLQQMSQPQLSMNSSGFTSTAANTRDLLKGGFGAGVGNSSDSLSQYFIKRAEQYQPVISIDEGIEVYVVFQEGFSLKEEEDEKKPN